MSITGIIVIAIVLCVAGIIQSGAGFGYGLFAIPLLLLLTDLTLPEIITIVSFCSFMQSLLGAYHLKESIPWKVSVPAIVIRIFSVLVGVFMLYKLTNLNIDDVKFIIGCILCGLVLLQLLVRVKPKQSVHWIWGGIAFSASGILSGICGMGGPPLVLWTMAHDWPVKKTRGFLFSVFAASIPLQLFLLYLTFGTTILYATLTALLYFPAVYLGTRIGMPIGNRLPRLVLRKIVYGILIFIGLNSIIPVIYKSVF